MEKVICDICATSYPATADECPICGYPRLSCEKPGAASAPRERVKGGRFSNRNVKKRNKAAFAAPVLPADDELPDDALLPRKRTSAADSDTVVLNVDEVAAAIAAAAPAAPAAPLAEAKPVQPVPAPVTPAAEDADEADQTAAVAAAVVAEVVETPAAPAVTEDAPAEETPAADVDAPAAAAPAADEAAPAVAAVVAVAAADTDDDADEDEDEDAAAPVAAAGAVAVVADPDEAVAPAADEEEEAPRRNPNKPLWITIALLLAAIALVIAYIAIRFFRSDIRPPVGTQPVATTTAPTETDAPTGTTAPAVIPCAAVSLERGTVELAALNDTYTLKVTTVPADTTDAVTFLSSDERVVTVSEDGVITAVGSGRANVIVACGDARVVCTVECAIPEETTVPPETTAPTETTEPEETTKATEPKQEPSDAVTLSHTDASLFTKGETFTISVRQGGKAISNASVTWSTSDASVATVDYGRVTGVGPGTATITAEYNGKTVECIVRCRFAAETEPTEPTETTAPTEPSETTEPTEPSESTEPTEETEPVWSISHEDVTLAVGESFNLRLRSSAGERAEVTWTASQEGVVTISGSTITGAAAGTVTVSTTYEGVYYACIVRVR